MTGTLKEGLSDLRAALEAWYRNVAFDEQLLTMLRPRLTPGRDGMSSDPATNVHFVVFNPSSDDFERNGSRWTGGCPADETLNAGPRSRASGFNSILTTTHRQNVLVPPRAHRSFPLTEL